MRNLAKNIGLTIVAILVVIPVYGIGYTAGVIGKAFRKGYEAGANNVLPDNRY